MKTCCAMLMVGALLSGASAQNEPAGPVLTLRSQARLVVLDVVVTDKRGAAVHDLKGTDFAIKESGKLQNLKAFEEHRPLSAGEQVKIAEVPRLPPGNFTNFTPAPSNSALNVLLLDTLNTALVDQNYVRQQLLKYLRMARPGTNLAIFGLSSRLYLLQGFTTDPELLRAAASKNNGKTSALLDDPAGLGNSDPSLSFQLQGTGAGGGYLANLQDFEADDAGFKVQLRAEYTLNAMGVLARFLADLPGRKNLIWFSGSFPINVLPSAADPAGLAPGDSFAGSASFQKQFQETTNLLARGRVAVYPVNAKGLETQPFNSAAQGNAGGLNPFASTPVGTGVLDDFTRTIYGEHQTMEDMARDTGGHAFLNTNGLAEAVTSAINQGSNYYTMAYTPTDARASGEFRKIEIQLTDEALNKGYKLAYRKGYFAEKAGANDSALRTVAGTSGETPRLDNALLRGSLAHGMPNASQFIYKVQILPEAAEDGALAKADLTGLPGFAPAKGPFRTFAVDFAAPARQTVFTSEPDGKHHASMQFITLVYTSDGKPVTMAENTMTADVDDKGLLAFRKTALTMHQEISVPAGSEYSIRTAVFDRVGNRVGSTEVPVSVLRVLGPAATETQK